MRKVILNLAVSLDGYIEDKHGEFDWCFTDQDYSDGQFDKFDTVFMGRKSYELMIKMNEIPNMKTYVFSDTLESSEQATVVTRKDCVNEVSKIKKQEGSDIWFFGGADLLTDFLKNNLIDELQLAVHPILLGGGKRLFQGNIQERMNCSLISVKTFDTGLVMMKYKMFKSMIYK